MTLKSSKKNIHLDLGDASSSERHGVEEAAVNNKKSVEDVFGCLQRKDAPVLSVKQMAEAIKDKFLESSSSHEFGFTLIELAVITLVVLSLIVALIPLVSVKVAASNLDVARHRGRDIYVAITGANTEREPLGLPPVWPSDLIFTNKITGYVEDRNFNNSTDYFKWLLDETNRGTDKWKPFVAGFDYSKLGGGGVPICENGKLTAECNMWTIAKNISLKTPDYVPFLVTRNVDATSLASRVTKTNCLRKLRFNPASITPFSGLGGVIVHVGGACTKYRKKYATYKNIYKGEFFDVSGNANGGTNVLPLKYLTPTREVLLSEQSYAEGMKRIGGRRQMALPILKSSYLTSKGFGLQFVLLSGCLYLVAALIICVSRFMAMKPCMSLTTLVCWLLHWTITNLYMAFAVVLFNVGWKTCTVLTILFVLMLHSIIVMKFRSALTGSEKYCIRCMKWLVAAPLLVWFLPAAGFAGLAMLILALGKPIFWCVNVMLFVAALVYLGNIVHRLKKRQ